MQVSVIIPTYNGAHKLIGILDALKKQLLQAIEIIVVVDGSTDNTIQMLQQLQRSISSLIIIEQENRGRGSVRNTGASKAKGDLLIFFDDDMLPLEDCIQKHVEHHQKNPASILTGGLSEPVTSDATEIIKYRAHLSYKWNKSLHVSESNKLTEESIFITAANFSIPRILFNELNGFDESLNDAEDFDFAIKAFKYGVALYFNESAFSWHNDKITCRSYIKRNRQYMVANKRLAELKPWIFKEGFRRPPMLPKGIKKYIFRAFCFNIWIVAVDKQWFKFLPKRMKYKLYDFIITANGVYYTEKVQL